MLGIAVVLLAIGSYALYWAMSEPPVSKQAIAKVLHGLSKDDVKTALGSPTRVSVSDNQEEWTYSHPLKWQYVQVRFKDGRVVQVELDE